MTNLGVERACRSQGIPFVRAKVGDRYVLEALIERKWTLGGETSGHILCLDRSTTGDGLVAALAVLEVMVTSGRSLAELVSDLETFPQRLINVRLEGASPNAVIESQAVILALRESEAELGARGRVVLRPSGTEPLVRVMVEADNQNCADQHAERLAAVVLAARA
jgi:phosphoglucosamine mutase